MAFLIGLLVGAAAGFAFGKLTRTAMGPLGDALLGVGGGVAGAALFMGLGLPGMAAAVIGGALGGVGMVAMIRALKA